MRHYLILILFWKIIWKNNKQTWKDHRVQTMQYIRPYQLCCVSCLDSMSLVNGIIAFTLVNLGSWSYVPVWGVNDQDGPTADYRYSFHIFHLSKS